MARTKLDIPTQTTASTNGVVQVASGNATASTALANGTTASTQSPGDNSTKLATTAYADAAAGGSGTVTTVSVVTANGFQGSVATPTTTPAISVNVDGSHYLPTTTDQANWNAKQPAGSYITSLTGGVTASGPGAAAATLHITSADVPQLVIGFTIGDGTAGTNIGPELPARNSGSFSKCVIVTKTSNASTALTLRIKKNGTNVFSSDPTVSAGTSGGTLSTFTSLTSLPFPVAANDIFTIDITSGAVDWVFTAILE